MLYFVRHPKWQGTGGIPGIYAVLVVSKAVSRADKSFLFRGFTLRDGEHYVEFQLVYLAKSFSVV